MNQIKKVYIFVDEKCVVAEAGHFDQWCAFGFNEMDARMKIQVRYSLGGRQLKLIKTIEDRRNPNDRRMEDRRSV